MYQSRTSFSPLSIPVCCYSITTDQWKSAMEFLTRTGQISTRPEFNILSDVLGATTVVEMLNSPQIGNATPSTPLGPFFTEDAPDRSSLLTSSACADPSSTHLLPAFLIVSRLSSLVWRVDRVGGKGRVLVRRGTCAYHHRRARSRRSHRFVGDRQHR